MPREERNLYPLLILILLSFATAALIHDGPKAVLRGFLILQLHPSRLLSDFTVIGGVGAALFNAATVGAMALTAVRLAGVRLSGPTFAAIFTILGFSLFGKTPLNTAPIMLGVYLAGRLVGKPFKSYIMIALFGTALGPLTGYLAFEAGLAGVQAAILGAVGGVAAGMLLPALAMAMLRLHEGYNLYNMGLTAGFLGLFFAAILSAAGKELVQPFIWNEAPVPLLIFLIPALSLSLITAGLLDGGPKRAWSGLLRIMGQTGRLPSDFMDTVSPAAALVNAGLLGLAGSAYVAATGGDFNGPVLGGLLTVIGFAGFGKHLKNCWPIVGGVLGASLLFGKDPGSSIPLLAALFGTTLAPLAGEFGPMVGLIAGFLHFALVDRTSAWHGGLDLYNNGFSGGLVATFMVALIEWIRSNKREK